MFSASARDAVLIARDWGGQRGNGGEPRAGWGVLGSPLFSPLGSLSDSAADPVSPVSSFPGQRTQHQTIPGQGWTLEVGGKPPVPYFGGQSALGGGSPRGNGATHHILPHPQGCDVTPRHRGVPHPTHTPPQTPPDLGGAAEPQLQHSPTFLHAGALDGLDVLEFGQAGGLGRGSEPQGQLEPPISEQPPPHSPSQKTPPHLGFLARHLPDALGANHQVHCDVPPLLGGQKEEDKNLGCRVPQ